MIRLVLFPVLLLGLVALPSRAQDSAFIFIDLPIGSPESLLHEKHPWGCQSLSQTPESLDMFMAERNCTPMLDAKNPGKYNTSADYGEWAGIRPRFYTPYYWHDQLSLVRIVFNAGFFLGVVEAFNARYGAPATVVVDTVRTRAGIPVPRTVYRWARSTSAVTLWQYTTALDESEAWYTLNTWEKASDDRRKERLKAKLP